MEQWNSGWSLHNLVSMKYELMKRLYVIQYLLSVSAAIKKPMQRLNTNWLMLRARWCIWKSRFKFLVRWRQNESSYCYNTCSLDREVERAYTQSKLGICDRVTRGVEGHNSAFPCVCVLPARNQLLSMQQVELYEHCTCCELIRMGEQHKLMLSETLT